MRIKGKVFGDNKTIDLVFYKYLSYKIYDLFEKGDIFLSFEKRDSKLYTIWGRIQPLLKENAGPNKICFAGDTISAPREV